MNWPERVWIYSPIRVLFQKREVNQWLRLARPPVGGSALEIGCGLGKGAQLLAGRMKFAEVIAFDLEHKLVRWAAGTRPYAYRDAIHFYVGDAQDLPFKDSSFDSVVNFGIIHHVLDWRRCINEIARVLKPGGLFFFEEIYPPLYANFLLRRMLRHPTEDRFYGPDYLQALRSAGLNLVEGVKTTSKYGIVGIAGKE